MNLDASLNPGSEILQNETAFKYGRIAWKSLPTKEWNYGPVIPFHDAQEFVKYQKKGVDLFDHKVVPVIEPTQEDLKSCMEYLNKRSSGIDAIKKSCTESIFEEYLHEEKQTYNTYHNFMDSLTKEKEITIIMKKITGIMKKML
tara:strand:+ start:2211 stop:2642 length:432 start_codon:yes stop_codon:yes gene_type:complete